MGKLTAEQVKALTQPGRYGDGAGLYLLISPGGSKSWTLRIQKDGKRTDKGLGGYPKVTIQTARTLAENYRVAVREGRNPWGRKENRTAAGRKAAHEYEERTRMPTFWEAAAQCRAALTKHKKWRSLKTGRMWDQSMALHVYPVIGDIPIDRITSTDVIDCLEPIWTATPEQARKVKQRIRTVFDWAVEMSLRDGNPVGAFRFALPAQGKLVKGHYLAVPYQDVPADLAQLKRRRGMFEPKPWKVTILCLEFLILTATRSAETREARWDEIDLKADVWTIPASRMKTAKVHRVPLSSQAREVLMEAREKLGSTHGLVFPSPSGQALGDNCLSVRTRMDEIGGTPHGFRASFRDWAAEKSGASREAIELSLAHAVGGAVETAYFRSDLLEQRRPLMDAWAEYVNPKAEAPF